MENKGKPDLQDDRQAPKNSTWTATKYSRADGYPGLDRIVNV